MIHAQLIIMSDDRTTYIGEFSFNEFTPDCIIQSQSLQHVELVEYNEHIISFIDTGDKVLMYIASGTRRDSKLPPQPYGIYYD